MLERQQTFYLEYLPFDDPINIFTDEEFCQQELPANHHYEMVFVPGDYESIEALHEWLDQENEHRRSDIYERNTER